MTEAQEAAILESLESHCPINRHGNYVHTIYAEPGDELPGEMLEDIADSDNPRDCFYDTITDTYWEAEEEILQAIIRAVIDDTKLLGIPKAAVTDYVLEAVHTELPYDHFLVQEICLNLMLDTGDGNHDFTINQPFASWDGQEATYIAPSSALLWLAQQQGYTEEQLTAALRDEDFQGSEFLESVYQEVSNVSTHMNAVTFLIKMPVKEWLELLEAIKVEAPLNPDRFHPQFNKGKGHITLKKTVTCGLYDPWNGAGGVLEIALDKDVTIPLKYIDSVASDGYRGYSVAEVYGADRSWWTEDAVVEVKVMTKEDVENAQEKEKREG